MNQARFILRNVYASEAMTSEILEARLAKSSVTAWMRRPLKLSEVSLANHTADSAAFSIDAPPPLVTRYPNS